MRFTLKNPRFLQYIDYQNVRKNGIFRLSKSGTLTETFVWGACTPLTSEARPRIFKNRVRAHRYIHVSSKVRTYLVH